MTKGTYGGGTFGIPWLGGLGGGLYIDNHGRVYPQVYYGTPGASLSAGYTDDLEGLLTGTSISGSPWIGVIRPNAGFSGGASGFGIGTPGVGVTYGFGPLEMSQDFSHPWIKTIVRDRAAMAGVPSRYNVFEYGFPDVQDAPAGARVSRSAAANDARATTKPSGRSGETSVFDTAGPPILYPYAGSLSGPVAFAARGDRPETAQDQPAAGGLLGMIQDYMRSAQGGRAGD
ncbi:hypothetical protein [Bradyrhizobium sp. HKCCYLR1023]|uniref:hypothetical protein n=1 Tax=Bradyrhizobium TaxID=374 RepID=UPI003EB8491B